MLMPCEVIDRRGGDYAYLEHSYGTQHGVVVLELLEAVLRRQKPCRASKPSAAPPPPSTSWREV
ncbi:hypothetical protein [Teichococcus vastitatis]|uniref:Uncharacterized protein n=1 Tax=Teichococcus vastitatis TaxID=2307076 RepID=A0ABS9W804_9PROT|nr:hypothetical protein [Pseudoroseomonas vastitatis]MCI0755035.1 hypothetical protein [Pseudoroseomonas vastitatis]